MNKNILLLLFILIAVFLQEVNAQGVWGGMRGVPYINRLDPDNRNSNAEGSPYMNKNYIKGDIYYTNEDLYEDIPLRYNVYRDEMEFLHNGKEYAIRPYQEINKIIIAGDTFIIDEVKEGRQVFKGFYLLLEEGKADLLARLNIKFDKAEPPKPYTDAKPARFTETKPDYYIRIGNDIPQEIRGIRRLIRTIDDKKDQLKAFAREENISRGNIKEIEKLIKYYNSL